MIRACEVCRKPLSKSRKKHCSQRCSQKAYYLRERERYREHARRWKENNPEKTKEMNKKNLYKFRTEKRERFIKLVLDGRRRHPERWKSRQKTRNLLNSKRPKNIPYMDIFCKKCGTEENLSLKFEVYPTKVAGIREAIENKKIYFICKECRKKK